MTVGRRLAGLVAALLVLGTALAGCANPEASTRRPNIIYVLTDDLSMNLVRHMPHVRAMKRDGTSFRRFYVTDSLCCPSRASILTGQYPHNTGVLTNGGPNGGIQAFRRFGDQHNTYGVALHRAGYRTGFMGKYLNNYEPRMRVRPHGKLYIPPGWDTWVGIGDGYDEFNYLVNHNRRIERHGSKPRDYLTDVLARKGQEFVRHSRHSDKPFFLQLSVFAPHTPSVPAPRDIGRFRHLKLPRTPAFADNDTAGALGWQRLPALSPRWKEKMQGKFQRRVRAVQAVDAMVGDLQAQLRKMHLDRNTYLIFSSDNGYHTGQHRLHAGKQTAYESDIRAPLIVTGPGVPAGKEVHKLTQTVDLYPTFLDLARADPAGAPDGRSLVRLLLGQPVERWRQAALVEHHSDRPPGFDPDRQPRRSGRPPTYTAIRRAHSLYVEYANGSREYYNTARDPYELHNLAGELAPRVRHELHEVVTRMGQCRGARECFASSARVERSKTTSPGR